MSYEVRTPVFEGPIDLLLQLITSHQLEVTELSLAGIVAEYLAVLDAMAELDMEVTSEFLLIAATLVQLKARHLLPEDDAVDLDEELALAEERDRLLSRLLACLTFKDVAAVLAHRFDGNRRYLGRSVGLDPDIGPAPLELRLDATPADLANLMAKVSSRPRDVELDHLELDLPSVDEAIVDLRRRIADAAEADFDVLTDHLERPIEVVAYFLALLELARWGLVGVAQRDATAAIVVTHRPEVDAGDIVSEWG